MSVTTMDRAVKVMKPVMVYTCDAKECSATAEQPATPNVRIVPPGWIYVQIEDPAVEGNHYCSKSCLFDAIQP